MKHQGKGYTIEVEDVKPSDKAQRMMGEIKVTLDGNFGLAQCKRCMNIIRISDTTCTHCGEGQ
ncbi:hypothetical protein VPH209E381_0006 [Vibrio phage 209E38-1]